MNIFSINFQSICNYPQNKFKPSAGITFKSAKDTFLKESADALETAIPDNFVIEKINKFIDIFKHSADKAPKILDLKVSPRNGQIMGFSLPLKNGNKLEVIKSFVHKFSKDFFFLTVKEFNNTDLKHSFGIDLNSKEFVKLTRAGKSKVVDFSMIEAEEDSKFGKCYIRLLTEYLEEIFGNSEPKTEKTVEVLKVKSDKGNSKTNKISVDDLLDDDVVLDIPQVEDIPEDVVKAESVESEDLAFTNLKENSQADNRNILQAKSNDSQNNKTKSVIKKESLTKPEPKSKRTKKNLQQTEVKLKNAKPKSAKRTVKPFKDVNNSINIEGVNGASVKPQLPEKIRTTKLIFMSDAGKLPSNITSDVESVERLLTEITAFLDKNKGNFVKIKALKENYEPLLYVPASRQKVTSFKLADNTSVGVIHTKLSPRFTRIIYRDENGVETHMLIDSREMLVSNLNKNTPWIVPVKFRYMTQEQVDKTNIGTYISFLKTELERYYEYLKANLPSKSRH